MDAVSETTEWSVCLQGKPSNIIVIKVYALTSNAEEAEVEWFTLEMNRDHSVLFETASKYCILDSLVDYEIISLMA